jgi:hypothetical protein
LCFPARIYFRAIFRPTRVSMDGSSFLASFSSDHEIRFNGGTIDSFPVKGEKVSSFCSSKPGDALQGQFYMNTR